MVQNEDFAQQWTLSSITPRDNDDVLYGIKIEESELMVNCYFEAAMHQIQQLEISVGEQERKMNKLNKDLSKAYKDYGTLNLECSRLEGENRYPCDDRDRLTTGIIHKFFKSCYCARRKMMTVRRRLLFIFNACWKTAITTLKSSFLMRNPPRLIALSLKRNAPMT